MRHRGFLCALLCVCLASTVAESSIAAGNASGQQTGESRPAPRFIDNGNGTVTDKHTGLVWLKKADCFGLQSWENAIALAENLASGKCGLNDGSTAGQWRLPDREELTGLVNSQQPNSAAWLNLQGFSQAQPNIYWTSTGSDRSTENAWFVDMKRGGAYSGASGYLYYMWPVRGGR